MRYEVCRSVNDKKVHVICIDGRFDDLPQDVRHRGPWQVIRRGEVADLVPDYRVLLENGGFVCIETDVPLFKPEG